MTSALQAKTYVVRPGDNLDIIARANGYGNWSVIYRSRCNQQLRLLRPDPNLIRPGDLVMLPPRGSDVYVSLQRRLERLRAVRRDSESLFDGIQTGLDAEFKKVESVGTTVDAANDVLNVLRGLSKLCWKGYKTLEMGSAELARANKELAREAVDFSKDPLDTVILKAFADKLDQPQTVQVMNSVWIFSAVVVRSWLDIGSPSYWAGAIAEFNQGSSLPTALTRRPADVRAEASARLAETRRKALEQVDGKIRDTERLLAAFRGPVTVPLPLK
jgi:hypothetical protein